MIFFVVISSIITPNLHRIIEMVQCEFSVLLEVHNKVRMLMQCMKIPTETSQATPTEKSILSDIISQLDRSLQHFFAKGQLSTEGDQEDAYAGIQKELQRQEQLNRSLIRRELEFKEFQKGMIDELSEQKKIIAGLQTQLLKANEICLAKDFEILHLSKEKKNGKQKKTKDIFAVDGFSADRRLANPFKALKESTYTLHRRGHSDELYVRSSTTNIKKKERVVKR